MLFETEEWKALAYKHRKLSERVVATLFSEAPPKYFQEVQAEYRDFNARFNHAFFELQRLRQECDREVTRIEYESGSAEDVKEAIDDFEAEAWRILKDV